MASGTSASTVILDVNATDADLPAPSLAYSLAGTDSARFSINATSGEIRFLAAPNFAVPSDANGDNVYLIQVAVSDGQTQVTQALQITVSNSNVAPLISPVGNQTTLEDVTLFLPFTVSDIETPAGQLRTTATSSDNTLLFPTEGLVISGAGGSRTLQLTPAADRSGTATIELTVSDSGVDNIFGTADDRSVTTSFTVTVTAVNDAPMRTAGALAPVFLQEDSGLTGLNLDLLNYGPGGGTDEAGQTLTYRVTSLPTSLGQVYLADGNTAVTVDTNYTLAQIRGLRFLPGANAFGNGQLVFAVRDTGGVTNGASDVLIETLAISIAGINDAPTFNMPLTLSVAEGTGTSTVTGWITDSIAGPGESTQVVTYLVTTDNDAFFAVLPTISAAGTLSFTLASNAVGNVQLTVRAQDNGGTANGGVDLSTPRTATLTVASNNSQPPVITSSSSATIAENTSPATVVLKVDAVDQDLPARTISYALSGIDANRFSINSATGEIRFLSSPDFDLPGDANGNNIYEVTVTATENSVPPRSASQQLTITVTGLNDHSPVITSSSAVQVAENTTTSTVILDVNATDADQPAQGLTYSLSGPDAARFNIDGATGEIRFISVPDFENPADVGTDNLYHVTVTVTDNGSPSLATSRQVTITVISTNDNPPVFTSSAAVQVLGGTLTTVVVLDVNATDADLPSQTLTYSLTGTDAGRFTISAETGEIRFSTTPVFANPGDADGDNIYLLQALVSDGQSTVSQLIQITVTNPNPIVAPVLALNGSRVTFINGRPAVVVVPNITVAGNSFAGGTLTVSINDVNTGKVKADIFKTDSLSGLGTVTKQLSGGRQIATIQLNAGVTAASVQQALRELTFFTSKKGLKFPERDIRISVVNSAGQSGNAIVQTVDVLKRAPRSRSSSR